MSFLAVERASLVSRMVGSSWPRSVMKKWRQVVDFGEQAWRASSQGQKGDAGGIEPIEPLIGGELGVEDEMLRRLAVLALPEVDEAENLIGLLALANIGV